MASFDVTEAFDDLEVILYVVNVEQGSYVAGEWVDGAETSIQTNCVVQPLPPSSEQDNQPEGYIETKKLRFFTKRELKVSDQTGQTTNTFIDYNGDRYRIYKVEDWFQIGGYYLAFGEIDQ
jgi:hypothetical protein